MPNWLSEKKNEQIRTEDGIKKLLNKQVSVSATARILDVNLLTVSSSIKTRKLGK